jgi:hypothetical protein
MVQNPYDPNGPEIHDPKLTIFQTDTRPIGPVIFGMSAGLVYHISRHFALSLEGKALSGAPDFGAVLQGGLSAQLAFGGAKGPAVGDGEEGDEGEVVGPGGGDAPPAGDEPPTSDLGNEEE